MEYSIPKDKAQTFKAALTSGTRFINLGRAIINVADVSLVMSDDDYDDQKRTQMGYVSTQHGYMTKQQFRENQFLNIQRPVEVGNITEMKQLINDEIKSKKSKTLRTEDIVF